MNDKFGIYFGVNNPGPHLKIFYFNIYEQVRGFEKNADCRLDNIYALNQIRLLINLNLKPPNRVCIFISLFSLGIGGGATAGCLADKS